MPYYAFMPALCCWRLRDMPAIRRYFTPLPLPPTCQRHDFMLFRRHFRRHIYVTPRSADRCDMFADARVRALFASGCVGVRRQHDVGRQGARQREQARGAL